MAADRQIGRAVVFGGSGFLGREVVLRLVAEGIAARVAVRHPDGVDLPEGSEAVYADVRDETSVAQAMAELVAVTGFRNDPPGDAVDLRARLARSAGGARRSAPRPTWPIPLPWRRWSPPWPARSS